jgi:hypothetical protein
VNLELSKGSVEVAKYYKEETGFTHLKDDMICRYPMSVANKELGNFGVGVYFYLDYFKSFAKLFFLMSLLMIP